MSTLVRDLLAYARLTTEIERPSSIALDEDLEAALTHLEQAIDESGARVAHDPMPNLPVDRGQMVRLFQNLVGNAVKYRQANGPAEIHISAEARETEWTISIRDNGIGFDMEDAATVFAPFKRLHTAEEYPGTGVGLAIWKRIVQAQGGRIWAESQPGQGATFFFTLPVETAPPLNHTPPIDTPRRPPSTAAGGSLIDEAPPTSENRIGNLLRFSRANAIRHREWLQPALLAANRHLASPVRTKLRRERRSTRRRRAVRAGTGRRQ